MGNIGSIDENNNNLLFDANNLIINSRKNNKSESDCVDIKLGECYDSFVVLNDSITTSTTIAKSVHLIFSTFSSTFLLFCFHFHNLIKKFFFQKIRALGQLIQF